MTVPRSVVTTTGSRLEMHGFSDASKRALCATVYVIEYKNEVPVNQTLLAAKSRVAPKDTSIPRLELTAALMLAKLESNINRAFKEMPLTLVRNWVDSTAVLYWLVDRGQWSVYVANRVKGIRELIDVDWAYIPTSENPSDIGTRGAGPAQLTNLWFKGPMWLSRKEQWPEQPDVYETLETEKERGGRKQLVKIAVEQKDDPMENILHKYNYNKLMRVTAYVLRFVRNSRREGINGPLTEPEITLAENWWIKRVQTGLIEKNMPLGEDKEGVIRINGRVVGYNPIYIPNGCILDRLIAENSHQLTEHGGVFLTI